MQKVFSKKLWKVMKLCALQGMIATIICGVSIASDNYGQVLDKPVTISVSAVSFERALGVIEVAANVRFHYSLDQIRNENDVSINVVDQPLRMVLDDMLLPRKFDYKVNEKSALISIKKQIARSDDQSVIGHTKIVNHVATITGIVTESTSGQPMAGVNVIIKGTTTGTTTDANGEFRIEALEKDVLVFSFIGYKPSEVSVGNQQSINITMTEDLQSLDEVIVNAGYWNVKDKEQTGNIGKVSAEVIQQQPVSNPLAALQARVPGLEIIQQSGVPGGNFQVRIRGQNSIANGNEPLFIIDGVPFANSSMAFDETSINLFILGTSPLNGINPMDIESIEVLKDADATAIYGSRGANGVILITTKKGHAGKSKIDVNFYSGAGKIASRMDLLSREEYLKMRREAFANAGVVPTTTSARDLMLWDTTRYTDWQEELIGGSATTTDLQIGASGGNRNTQFSVGGGFHQEGTVFPGSNTDRRFSTLMSLSNNSNNEKFSSTLSMKFSFNDTDLIKNDLTEWALRLVPVAPPIYTEDGDLNWKTTDWDMNTPNPLSYLRTGYDSKTKNLLLSGLLSYLVLKNFSIKTSVGYTDISMDAVTTTPKSSLSPAAQQFSQNTTNYSSSSLRNWTVEPQLNWKPIIGKGRLDILVGTTFLEQIQEGLAQRTEGYIDESLMKNPGAASVVYPGTNNYSQYRYHAVFGRINLTLKDRYIVNLTGRRDGSSRFGPNRQFANFGALGIAWIFSEEKLFQENLPFISFGKLRGSYGLTGNDQLPNYQYLDTYTTSGIYDGQQALGPVRLANPDFAWETNQKLEGGLELGFFDNRIETSVSYFRNRSSNQLVGYPLPPTVGFPTIQGNFPAVILNTGLEIELITRNIKREKFTWSTSFNAYVPRNELLEFPNLESSAAYANTLVVGEPLSIRKVYNYTGLDPATGYYKFEDMNADGVINLADRTAYRYVGQYYSAGLVNTFTYKGLQLDISFQYVRQDRNNYLNAFLSSPGYSRFNQPDWVMDRSTSINELTNIQPFSTIPASNSAYSLFRQSSESVSDASFLRLKNVYIAYALPKLLTAKIGLSASSIFIQGQNLLTLTSFKGLDPETPNTSLPPLRVISLGFHFTF